MWNICRAQCPSYHKDLLSPSSGTSHSFGSKKKSYPGKPVTTLSASYWLNSSSTLSLLTASESSTTSGATSESAPDSPQFFLSSSRKLSPSPGESYGTSTPTISTAVVKQDHANNNPSKAPTTLSPRSPRSPTTINKSTSSVFASVAPPKKLTSPVKGPTPAPAHSRYHSGCRSPTAHDDVNHNHRNNHNQNKNHHHHPQQQQQHNHNYQNGDGPFIIDEQPSNTRSLNEPIPVVKTLPNFAQTPSSAQLPWCVHRGKVSSANPIQVKVPTESLYPSSSSSIVVPGTSWSLQVNPPSSSSSSSSSSTLAVVVQEDLTMDPAHSSTSSTTTSTSATSSSADPHQRRHHLTEYKRQFTWNRPMVAVTATAPADYPVNSISQYQDSYGNGHPIHDHTTTDHAPSSLVDHPPTYHNKLAYPVIEHETAAGLSSTAADLAHADYHITRAYHKPDYDFEHGGQGARPQTQATGPLRTTRSSPNSRPLSRSSSAASSLPGSASSRRSRALFDFEPPCRAPSPIDTLVKQSEYHSQFKPFDDYIYIEGDGFKKCSSSLKSSSATSVAGGAEPKAWFSEVKERNRQARQYRARSQNGATPVNPSYPWNGATVKDRSLQALALATRLVIEEKRAERKLRSSSVKPATKSAASRNLSSAPSSLRNEPQPVQRSIRGQKPVAPSSAASSSSGPALDRNNNPAAKGKASSDSGAQKVWIKPKAKPSPGGAEVANDSPPAVSKPGAVVAHKPPPVPKFESEPKSCPLTTTQVKSPEQISGIKSPSPESWKVSIEKGGLNWVNGNTPVNFDGKCPTVNQESVLKPVPINIATN